MNELLKKEISETIIKYFGHSTAEAFAYSHKEKTDDFIILALEKLFTEYLGKEKAQEELNKLRKDL